MATKSAVRLTASGKALATRGRVSGFFVAATSSGTVVLYDGQDTSGTQLSGTITPAAGAFYPFPVDVQSGLYASIGGASLDVTFFTE